MKKSEFKNFVRNILLEVKKEKDDSRDKVEKKSEKSDYRDGTESKYHRELDNDPDKTVSKLLAQVTRLVKKIDKKIKVVLDDHNDISVKLPGVFTIRITPKWSGVFDIEAFRNMTDRVYAIALTNEQVLNFIKVNFSNKDKKSYVQSAYDKSMENAEDNTKKKAKELPKGEPVKHMDADDLEYEEGDDETDSEMEPVKEKKIERQEDHGVEKNKMMSKIQRMIKKEVDDSLTKSWKK
jgi:hypothetical protein